ncbi:hypothetical protein ACJ41O_001102 [Fusarium nematophilum]
MGFSEIEEVAPEPIRPVDEDAHSALEAHVRSLNLAQEMTDQIVDSISWKKQHRQGLRSENKKELDRNNSSFAHASVVILLSLCQKISTLRVGYVGTRSLVGNYLLMSNYGRLNQPILQHLSTFEILAGSSVDLGTRFYDTTEFLDYIRLVSRLPSIETITMEGLGEYQANRKIFPPGISPIRKIRMSHVSISSSMLSTIIRGPKHLEELSVSTGGLLTRGGGVPANFPKTLGKSLLQHRPTLKVLDLDIPARGYERELLDERVRPTLRENDEFLEMDEAESVLPRWVGDIPDDRTYGWTIGSFHDFEALTHLSIHARALFGPKAGHIVKLPYDLQEPPPVRLVDSLPPNLEYFCLYGHAKGENEEIDGQVAELMEKRAERFPRLKEIRGVESKVLGVGQIPNHRDREKDLWRRPERDWSWGEVAGR